MISHLTGRLSSKEPGHCVVDVGGVGYGLAISLNTFARLPDPGLEVSIPVHTYVREDQLVLFGFASNEERATFRRLIGVSGIGPKTAMAVLSGLAPVDLAQAVSCGDSARLATIPGIGKKTAERMVVELKDLLPRDLKSSGALSAAGPASTREDAISALVNLGYPRATAEGAIGKVNLAESTRVEDALKAALKELCRA